ncbi:P-loop containing nucleoside triphosphate hydrolase protein [Apiospora aurea]|uniref:P-loop containing nucleoside triphosphate hydrolase protein n=1 Tax=Apiospora aurea TaxID=335848 RepID=A0ABR1PRL3_9PEZI
MERHDPMPGASQFAMRQESMRMMLYEQESESDTDSSLSSGSSSPDNVPKRTRRKAKSMFIDDTIAQDDIRGQTAETVRLLADMGLELIIKDVESKYHAAGMASRGPGAMLSSPPIPSPFGRGVPPGVRPPASLLPPLPRAGPPRPLLPPGAIWMRDKVNLNSTWRHTLARRRSTAEASGGYDVESADHASVPPNEVFESEEIVQDQTGSAGVQSLASPQALHRATTDTGMENDSNTVADGEHRGADGEFDIETTDSKETGNEATKAQPPPVEHEPSSADGVSRSVSPGTPPKATGLAEALGEIADRHLEIDVLDHSHDTSRYIGYLLDTIHSLESRLFYKGARDPVGKSEKAPQAELPANGEKGPRSQVLHRVVCSNSWHDHGGMLFEDEPEYQTDATHEYKLLSGNKEVSDVRYYVEEHPEILFIVLKEHECGSARRQRDERAIQSDSGRTSERNEIIQIVSKALNDAFKRIAEFDPYGRRNSDGRDAFVGTMEAPYLFLFHHHQKLKDLVGQEISYRPILDPLLLFLEQNYGEEYRSANELFQRGLVTAYHSSKLYKPHDIVVTQTGHGSSLSARLLSRFPERTPKDRDRWTLEGWSWTYNGREARREGWTQDTDSFLVDEFPITKLPIYPLKYARPEIINQIRETGRQFWSMRHQSLRCYTGWDEKHDRYYTNERFVVDVTTYYMMFPNRSPKVFKVESIYDKWPQRIDAKEEMPPSCEFLLPGAIEGFNLGSKKWVALNVNNFLPEVDWNKNAFKQLVLDEKTKEMIHALVVVQKSRDKAMDDIIKGKGNGLILLLHGSPGTGKTLTAESVAEIAEKPLYRVTCGDIGTEAQEVERYLQTVLFLGKIWDCVLLLDEADVFLEERTMADLARNSLVSVFLRILEYYDGILILTSNRVGTFDEAFKSRIQVAIHYDNLTKKSRKAIWRNFFDMIQESDEEANMPELEGRLDDLALEEMNGRQIRNALLTARQLAQHRGERLDWEHLNQVIKTAAAFNKYLKTVKGHTDDRWAREEGIR